MSIAPAKLPSFIAPAMLVPPVGKGDAQTSEVISGPPNFGNNFSPNWNKLWSNGVKIRLPAQGIEHKVRIVAGVEVRGCELRDKGQRRATEVSLIGAFLYHPSIDDDAAIPLVMGLFCYQYEKCLVQILGEVQAESMMIYSKSASGGLYTYVESDGVGEERRGVHRSTSLDEERFGSLFQRTLHYPVNTAVGEELAQIPNVGDPIPRESQKISEDGREVESDVWLWDPEERTIVRKDYIGALLDGMPNADVKVGNEYTFPFKGKKSPGDKVHFRIFQRWAKKLPSSHG